MQTGNFLTTDATDLRKKVFGSWTNKEQYLAFLNIFWVMNDTQIRIASKNIQSLYPGFQNIVVEVSSQDPFLDPTIITTLFHFQFIEMLTRITSFFEFG